MKPPIRYSITVVLADKTRLTTWKTGRAIEVQSALFDKHPDARLVSMKPMEASHGH